MVTKVSRHSYSVYYLLSGSGYAVALRIVKHASELRKHLLFRQTAYGPGTPAKRRPSAGQVTCATSIRCGDEVAGSSHYAQTCSTMSCFIITLSSLSARRASELAGRPERADDDQRPLRRPPRQGRTCVHAVTVKGNPAFSQRTLALCAQSR